MGESSFNAFYSGLIFSWLIKFWRERFKTCHVHDSKEIFTILSTYKVSPKKFFKAVNEISGRNWIFFYVNILHKHFISSLCGRRKLCTFRHLFKINQIKSWSNRVGSYGDWNELRQLIKAAEMWVNFNQQFPGNILFNDSLGVITPNILRHMFYIQPESIGVERIKKSMKFHGQSPSSCYRLTF